MRMPDHSMRSVYGSVSVWRPWRKGLQKYGKLSPVIAGSVATVLCLLVPIQMGAQNWDDDRSNRYVCRDFGANYLESCEPNAVIFYEW